MVCLLLFFIFIFLVDFVELVGKLEVYVCFLFFLLLFLGVGLDWFL